MPAIRIRGVAVSAALALVLAACADRSTDMTGLTAGRQHPVPSANDPIDISSGGVLFGRATITITELGATAANRSVADTTDFSATVRPGAPAAARLVAAGTELMLPIAADARVPQRQGTWRVQTAHMAQQGMALDYTADGAAPPSRMRAYMNGQLVAETNDTWRMVSGGWVLQRRLITAYRAGAPVRSVDVEFAVTRSEPLPPSGVGELPGATPDALVPPRPHMLTSGDVACESEIRAAQDANEAYLFSVAGLGGATLTGNIGAIYAAGLAVLAAGRRMEVAQERLNACVEKA
ncbi:MAG TPA: hypothetical protein VG818_01100 [Gemmatimonadaceae bacterium]|jgi:hypothetical protein|nr:hypothetical protein [Gemmatimonadaceae bacterium]